VFSQSYHYETYVVQYSTRQFLCKYNVEIFMETSRRKGPDTSKRQIGHRSSATCLHMASSITSESREILPCDTVSTYIWTREPWIAVSQIPRAAYFGLNVFVPSALHTYTLSLLPPFGLDLYGILWPDTDWLKQPQSSTFQGFWSTFQRADTSKRHVITKFQIV
jgi:hypothetical protein